MSTAVLRHAGSNRPDAPKTGNRLFSGTSPIAGHGVTLSCFRCGKHHPQHTYGKKARIFGALHHVCQACKEKMGVGDAAR